MKPYWILVLLCCLFLLSCKRKTENHLVLQENLAKKIVFDTIYRRAKSDTLMAINTKFDDTIIEDLNDKNETNIVRFMYFSNNLDTNFNAFVQKAFASCRFLDSITIKNDQITLFLNKEELNQQKYVGDSVAWVYNYYFYHDIYHAFFSFNTINSIKVIAIDESKNITNETFLPKTGEDEYLIEGGIMYRKWYKKTPKQLHYFFEKKRAYFDLSEYGNDINYIKSNVLDTLFSNEN